MKQLTASNHMSGTTIVQRYVDGVRYLKVTPKNILPLIMEQLKRQFIGKPVEIDEAEGWIRIKKTGRDEQLEKGAKRATGAVGDSEIDEDYVLNKEAEMLKQQGYVVKLEEIK